MATYRILEIEKLEPRFNLSIVKLLPAGGIVTQLVGRSILDELRTLVDEDLGDCTRVLLDFTEVSNDRGVLGMVLFQLMRMLQSRDTSLIICGMWAAEVKRFVVNSSFFKAHRERVTVFTFREDAIRELCMGE